MNLIRERGGFSSDSLMSILDNPGFRLHYDLFHKLITQVGSHIHIFFFAFILFEFYLL